MATHQISTVPGSPFIKAGLALGPAWLLWRSPTLADKVSIAQDAVGLAVLFSIAALLYCAITVVYRIWFHPLAKYPGPVIASITDLYWVYHSFIGDRHLKLFEFHQKYGSIVRYGPHRISLNTNTALRQLYHVRTPTKKSDAFSIFSHFFVVPIMQATMQSKFPVFKSRAEVAAVASSLSKTSEENILDNVRIFEDSLIEGASVERFEEWSASRNMSDWPCWMMNDIMGELVFHRHWNMLGSPADRDVVHILEKGFSGINMIDCVPNALKPYLHRLFFGATVESTYKFERLALQSTKWRKDQNDLKQRDIFSSIVEAKDPVTGEGLSIPELAWNAGVLVIAGSDTTGSAITATIFYLLHKPSTLELARQEILDTFKSVDEIRNGTKLHSCTYLWACIQEALRLSPGVPGMLLREVTPPGLTVDDEYFPAGTDLGVASYAVHHNAAYFPDPFAYNPGRWLTQEQHPSGVKQAQVTLAKSAWVPFSVGLTSCPGRQLAEHMIMLVMGRMLFLFDMRIKPGSRLGEGGPSKGRGRERKDELQMVDAFLARHDGPEVEFRRRVDAGGVTPDVN